MAKLAKRQNPAEMMDDDNPEWAEDFFQGAICISRGCQLWVKALGHSKVLQLYGFVSKESIR